MYPYVILCTCTHLYVIYVQELICYCLPQERDIGDEYGWKQVHGDVFRPPVYPTLFTSLVGCGHQLAVVAIGCILSELLGHLYTQ